MSLKYLKESKKVVNVHLQDTVYVWVMEQPGLITYKDLIKMNWIYSLFQSYEFTKNANTKN